MSRITVSLAPAEYAFLDAVRGSAPRSRALRALIAQARAAASAGAPLPIPAPLRDRVRDAYAEIAEALARGRSLLEIADAMGVPASQHASFRTYFYDARRNEREKSRAIARALAASQTEAHVS